MEQYNVTGMSCAACSARVEKAVSKVPGVTSCSVSLLTNSMGVEGTAQLRRDHQGSTGCRIRRILKRCFRADRYLLLRQRKHWKITKHLY